MPRPRKEYFGESDPSDNDSENSSDREFEKRIMMDEPKREDSEPAEILDSDYCLNYPGEYFTHQIDNIISHRTKYMHSEITNHLKKEEENQNSQGSINDDIQDILEANEKEKEKYKEEEVEDEVKLEKGKIKRTKKSKKKQDSIKEAQQEPQADNTMKEPEERQEKNYANLTEDDFIFLIKFVNKSHHYCKWMTQTEIVNHSAEGEQKLKRYKSRMMKHGGLLPTQCVYDDAFDPSYLQVERILFTTNMFPVVHPRLVKKTEGTWLEDLQKVMCILLNFSKRTHNIGLHFLDINYNPENDENRKKSPDFLTLLNRLYTKKITTQVQFWCELGEIIDTFCHDHQNEGVYMFQVAHHMKELSYVLYKDWYKKACDRHQSVKEEIVKKEEMAKTPQNEDAKNDEDPDEKPLQEYPHPGEMDFSWLRDTIDQENKFETLKSLTEEDLERAQKVDQLYLVKWRSLSYQEVTWEPLSKIQAYMGKIKDFEMFNRCHSSTMREKMCGIMYAHTAILKYYEGRLQMKGRGSYRQKERDIQKEQSYRNFMDKLYQYDSIEKTQCIQYGKTKVSQPKFRGENLQLKDYQVDGLNWLIRAWHERRNVVLADEMGLGKTIISVTFLDHIAKTTKVFGPFLIVAPLSTLDHWVRVVQDWTYLNPVLYYDSKGGNGRQALMDWEWYMPEITQGGNTTLKNSIFKPHVVITSYEVFMQDIRTVLKHVPFMYMVIDEAHRLKNAKTKVLSLMKEHPCRNILLLTGTPVQNNTSELFSILNYIEPDKFCDEEAFKERFGNLTNNDQISDLKKLIKPHFLRRKKDDVEFSIPPLNETVIEVGLTSLQKAYYKGIYSENRSVLAQFGSSSVKTSQLNNLDMQLRKCCDHLYMLKGVEEDLTENIQSYDEELQKLKDASGKLILVDKFIEKYRKQNHKILIFSQFTSCLEILERYLVLKRIRTEKLTGSINSTDRVLSIQRFNEDKRFGVFLLTTKAGGLGINLAIARVVIIFDSDWNPQNDLQAIARAHRIGQKFSVQVYRLITADTYEQEMFKRASKKLGMEQAIFSKGDFTDENFSNTGNFNEIKNNPNEVENLLKHGAYAFLNEENDKENDIESLDIDKLIEDAGKGGLKKGYNYEKKTFDVAEHERDIPDFQNDKFWNKIFSDDIPSVANLEKEFKSNRKKLLKNQEALVIFLDKLDRAIEDLMDSCKNKQTLSDLIKDDEEKIRFILEAVLKSKTVDLDAKERAKDMLDLVTSTLYQHQTFTKKARKDLSKVKGKSGPRLKKRSRPSTQQSENENDPNMIMGCQSLAAAMSTPKDSQDKSSSQNSGGFNLGLRSKRLEKIKQKKLENEEMERRHSKVENLINSKLVRSRQKRLPSINYAETESISDSSPTNNAHSLPLETPYIDEDYQKDLNTEHDEEILPIQKPKKPKKSKKSKKVKKVKTKPRKH